MSTIWSPGSCDRVSTGRAGCVSEVAGEQPHIEAAVAADNTVIFPEVEAMADV